MIQTKSKEINYSKSINMANFKHVLLASLYSQIEFLRNRINEKDLLIRTFIITEKYVYDSSRLSCDKNKTSNLKVNNRGASYRTEHFETEKVRVDISDSEC